ncbi:MAG: vitamin K epoxide reductase [Candidatus Peregrinibacteria bacterium GW2011_GWE2_39_6]|nr:MAG: vitamin K epoxide reductase [Candidatus Peregrinibacteria bacterium GW2011_GWF2_39_17]KKR24308.1 MAG: vitamin K epoxide reductase [Candidatus Peregrinibacteria bacterium GW2011_GWE2_39_6]HCW31914.1 hypothetical protein [Candidatus Peregrinibacteria bacterium]
MVNIILKDAISPAGRIIIKRLKWFTGLSFLAMLFAAYLVYLHFEPTSDAPCNINEYLNCDVVNRSSYSEILGIPVAIIGFLAYGFFFLMGRALYKKFRFTKWHRALIAHNLYWLLLILLAIGILFCFYLTYIEFFVLQVVCIFCVAQQIIILINLFLMVSILRLSSSERKGEL